MGGDEFTILLEEVTDPSHAMRAAKRILLAVAEPFIVEGREVRTSASVGIALSTATHERAEDLLQDAEAAMRRAKAMGGSRCEVFDEAMHTRAINRLKLEAEWREALEKNQFRVYYQPVVHLETKQIIGFEVVPRWQHPEQGLISLDQFMSASADRGLLASTGQWLILEACTRLRAWDADTPPGQTVSVSVNVSATQLADAAFVTGVETTLRSTGVAPSRLQLEIAQSAAAADAKLTSAIPSNLKRLGVGVILNDFGTGISSLSRLRQFPVEALKISRSLIGGMLLDRDILETVELVVLVSHKLKLKVIAEGIESAKQLDHLRQLGCELGQGSFFSHSVDATQAEELLRQRTLSHAKVAGAP